MLDDRPPDGFLRIDFDRDRPETTFNSHIGTLYAKRGAKGTRDEFVLGFRVHQHMCNPAGGLHGGMMMTVADLVGTMGGGTLVGLRKFLPTVSMTFDFVAPARVGDWVEGRAEVVRQTRSLLFTNIYLTVGEEKFLRASQIAKIPSGEGLAFGKAKLDRSAAGAPRLGLMSAELFRSPARPPAARAGPSVRGLRRFVLGHCRRRFMRRPLHRSTPSCSASTAARVHRLPGRRGRGPDGRSCRARGAVAPLAAHEMAWLDREAIPLWNTTSNHTTYDEMSEAAFRAMLGHLPRNGPTRQEGLSYFVRRGDL